MERKQHRMVGLLELSDRDRDNLLACVKAELELLSISGEDYRGSLTVHEIIELRDLLTSAKKIYTSGDRPVFLLGG